MAYQMEKFISSLRVQICKIHIYQKLGLHSEAPEMECQVVRLRGLWP